MTARTAGFRSRAELKMRAPRSYSTNIRPQRGGAALHYGGPPVRIRDHGDCERTWRGWQAYHMDTHGWADIGYTAGFCQHGHVLAGRGHGVRTAAQGTNDGNSRFHAYCWIGGDGQVPTIEAMDAAEWLVAEGRRLGAGDEVKPHRLFHSTACPGGVLTALAADLHNRPTRNDDDQEDMLSALTPDEQRELLQKVRDLHVIVDYAFVPAEGEGAFPGSQGKGELTHLPREMVAKVREIREAVDPDDPEPAA